MTSKKPDFKNANIKANEILVASNNLASFPVKTKKIIKEWSDIKIKSFEYAHNKGIDIEAFGSEAAVIQSFHGKYIIFYNQNDYKPRIKFSLLHEFGHYYLGHKIDAMSEEEYEKCEVEANCFAAQILMPEQVINELKRRGAVINKGFLIRTFGVSSEAADKRLITLGKLNYRRQFGDENLFDETIRFKYQKFMDNILPPVNAFNWYEDEYKRQQERDNWEYDSRKRYNRY